MMQTIGMDDVDGIRTYQTAERGYVTPKQPNIFGVITYVGRRADTHEFTWAMRYSGGRQATREVAAHRRADHNRFDP
jgi:hypothetical protein